MNSYEKVIRSLCDEIVALESRCKVAEDLNKVYVRMYLEMQAMRDELANNLGTIRDDLRYHNGKK